MTVREIIRRRLRPSYRFYGLIVVWIISIFVQWNANLTETALTTLGTGPFVLYYYHQTKVDQPFVRPVDGAEVTCVKKILVDDLISPSRVYPYVEVRTKVENIGKATAHNCFIRVTLDSDTNYIGRWNGEINEEMVDVHPLMDHECVLFQLWPAKGELEAVNDELTREDYPYRIEVPPRFDLSPYSDPHSITVNGIELTVIRPIRKQHEEVLLHRLNGKDEQSQSPVPYGTFIDPSNDYRPTINIGAEDWRATYTLEELSLDTILSESDWIDQRPIFHPIREKLSEYE